MLFNSVEFLIFFIVVIGVYFAMAQKWRWAFLLGASYFFYASWNPLYTILIVFSTVIDFFVGIGIEDAKSKRQKSIFLGVSVVTNLGLLGFFKYYGFFSGEANQLLQWLGVADPILPIFNVLLPVGISFYTFQTLSYSIDVYRCDKQAERHLGFFALFVTFFPQLVAGPIERSTFLLPQLRNLKGFDYSRVRDGLQLVYWGLFKKIVVADWLADYVNIVYGKPSEFSGLPSLLATYFFAFQIYIDFSAYSEIARGCAKVFGVDLMINFKTPYASRSIKEFWQRWHISLSTWFRDYLYFPLGGSRMGRSRVMINLMIVFVISGIWHGANWTFLIWGAIHGVLLVLYLLTQNIREKMWCLTNLKIGSRVTGLVSTLFTFHLVLVSWVFFRAYSLSDAVQIFRNFGQILPLRIGDGQIAAGLSRGTFLFLFVGVFLVVFLEANDRIFRWLGSSSLLVRWATYAFLGFLIVTCGHFEPSQFIYFQF